MLGPGNDYTKEFNIFNRIAAWDQQKGLTYEGGPRHVEIIFEQLNLRDAKTAAILGARQEGRTQEEHREPLGDEQTPMCRALVARCVCIAPDRFDIAHAANELARGTAPPTKGDLQ